MTALDDYLLPPESPCDSNLCVDYDDCPFDGDHAECVNAAKADAHERFGRQDWEREE